MQERKCAPKVEVPEWWVLSDRVLFVSPEGSEQRAAALGIAGTKVVAVEDAEALRRGPLAEEQERRGVHILDMGQDPIVPGFVNGHTHLALAPLRGITDAASRSGNVIGDVYFRLESHLTPADVFSFTRLGAFESLLCGVTRVWDHYYFGDQVARALLEVGLGGVVAPTLQDLSGPGAPHYEQALEATLDIQKSARFARAGVQAALGPHATDTVSDGLLARVGQLAHREGLPIHLHAAQTFDEHERGRERFSSDIASALVDHFGEADVLIAHGLFFSQRDCRDLIQAGYVLAYCPYSQLQFGFLGPLFAWRSLGGSYCIGTDCVASNDALDVQRELPLVAGDGALRAGFSSARARVLDGKHDAASQLEAERVQEVAKAPIDPDELLSVATGFALPGHLPPLRVGSSADFLVLDSDHPTLFPDGALNRTLCYGATQGAIRWLSVQGRVWGANDGLARDILTSDSYRECLTEVRRRRRELFARAQMSGARQSE